MLFCILYKFHTPSTKYCVNKVYISVLKYYFNCIYTQKYQKNLPCSHSSVLLKLKGIYVKCILSKTEMLKRDSFLL